MPLNITDEASIDAAIEALKQWFVSQDLSPKDGGMIMAKLIAELIVNNGKTPQQMLSAINDFDSLIACEIAQFLHEARLRNA